jgi:cell filamentation protein
VTGDDPYVTGDGVLTNNLGITSAAELSQAEADLSFAALLRLSVEPLPGDYDLAHLQGFHRHIFGTIYPWAGRLRTVDIAKAPHDVFCHWAHIESSATIIFDGLARENRLRGLPRDPFVKRLAHYYGEINALHPFREGNGRTQRAFLGQLARDAGHRLAWSAMSPTENNLASAASLHGTPGPLTTMLQTLLRPR